MIIYYRWAYSPTTGDVTLSNNEGHPADIQFHAQMAQDRTEPDLVFGYAYRMENGWKVTDADHRPEQDPHIRVAVENEVTGREAPRTAHVEWEESLDLPEKTTGKTRYGQPIEKLYAESSTDQEITPFDPDPTVSD